MTFFLLNSQWVINKPERTLGGMRYTWKKRKLLLNEVVCCAKCFIKSLLGICQFACSISWDNVVWTPLVIRSWVLSDLSYRQWKKKSDCHRGWWGKLKFSIFCNMLPNIGFFLERTNQEWNFPVKQRIQFKEILQGCVWKSAVFRNQS